MSSSIFFHWFSGVAGFNRFSFRYFLGFYSFRTHLPFFQIFGWISQDDQMEGIFRNGSGCQTGTSIWLFFYVLLELDSWNTLSSSSWNLQPSQWYSLEGMLVDPRWAFLGFSLLQAGYLGIIWNPIATNGIHQFLGQLDLEERPTYMISHMIRSQTIEESPSVFQCFMT